MIGRTLFDKIWDSHVVKEIADGWVLLHIDRHLLHDLSGPANLQALADKSLPIRNPELVFATADHTVSSQPGRDGSETPVSARLYGALKEGVARAGVPFFDLGEEGQGIVHVMAPELGLVLPGSTLVCGDSHTCTNGALGALAFGIGTSEGAHALATGVMRQRKPKRMRITIDGPLGRGVSSKDLILHIIGRFGAAAGVGHAVEYAGSTVRAMSVEARLSLCNPSIELGAKSGIIAPDEVTVDYLRGRRFAPKGEMFERAARAWLELASDADAEFDCELGVDAAEVVPTVTWGTSPEHAIAVDGIIPDPDGAADQAKRENGRAALDYMGLEPGRPLAGAEVDIVFIGSCNNSRMEDLRAAAAVARGRKVAEGVRAWVVAGSELVKRQAEAEGIDRVFLDAGFEWREPGCSMCVAANGEAAPPGARVVSTSNRNFVGRQGPGARTHLASPAMAAAAAVTGVITDVRRL